MVVQVRSSRQTSIPLRSGSTRSRITASGGRRAAAVSASSRGGGSDDVVAGSPQRRLQRSQDLRLVVDDEDARPVHTEGSSTAGASGSASANEVPCPGTRLGPDAARVGLDEAAGDRKAEAGTSRRHPADAMERLEDPLTFLFGQPGALVDDPDHHFAPRRGDAHRDGRLGRGELDRVLEQVHERPLDLDRIDEDDRDVIGDDGLDPVCVRHQVERLGDQLVDCPQLLHGLCCAGLQAREVEQVGDETLEAPRLDRDRLQELLAIPAVEVEALVLQPADGRRDRGQR